MKKVECTFENTDEWEDFIEYLHAHHDRDLLTYEYNAIKEGYLELYTWNVEFLKELLEDTDFCHECVLTDFQVTELTDREWKKTKKKIRTEFEEPLDLEEVKKIIKKRKFEKFEDAFHAIDLRSIEVAQFVPDLISILRENKNPKIKTEVTWFLCRTGELAAPALPLYIKELSSEDVRNSTVYINAIGILGPIANEHGEFLLSYLKNSLEKREPEEFSSVFSALERIGYPVEKLTEFKKSIITSPSIPESNKSFTIGTLTQDPEFIFNELLFIENQLSIEETSVDLKLGFVMLLSTLKNIEIESTYRNEVLNLLRKQLKIEEENESIFSGTLIRKLQKTIAQLGGEEFDIEDFY